MSDRVSRYWIEMIVDRYSCDTPDDDIAEIIRDRLIRAGRLAPTAVQVRNAVAYAVKHHHRNRDLYRRVMTGRI